VEATKVKPFIYDEFQLNIFSLSLQTVFFS